VIFIVLSSKYNELSTRKSIYYGTLVESVQDSIFNGLGKPFLKYLYMLKIALGKIKALCLPKIYLHLNVI